MAAPGTDEALGTEVLRRAGGRRHRVIHRSELADAREPVARPRSSANGDVARSIVPAAGLIAT
jgi:hypothetical protein